MSKTDSFKLDEWTISSIKGPIANSSESDEYQFCRGGVHLIE